MNDRRLKATSSEPRRQGAPPVPFAGCRGRSEPGCWSILTVSIYPRPLVREPHTEISDRRFGVTGSWHLKPRNRGRTWACCYVSTRNSPAKERAVLRHLKQAVACAIFLWRGRKRQGSDGG